MTFRNQINTRRHAKLKRIILLGALTLSLLTLSGCWRFYHHGGGYGGGYHHNYHYDGSYRSM